KQNPEKEHVEIWPSQENMMLGEAVEKMGKKWDEISKMFVNRTPSQCEAQWKAIQPRRGKWSPTEDQSLLAAYHSITEQDKAEGLGANTSLTLFWFKVASLIPGRSGQQCMARYLETLDPKLKKGKWDPEEDQLLNEGFQLYGKSWVKISAPIQGRTQRQCRTRWLQLNK
ncbi:Homeodomain-like protein, partial [Globomyces pollinis-pini]